MKFIRTEIFIIVMILILSVGTAYVGAYGTSSDADQTRGQFNWLSNSNTTYAGNGGGTYYWSNMPVYPGNRYDMSSSIIPWNGYEAWYIEWYSALQGPGSYRSGSGVINSYQRWAKVYYQKKLNSITVVATPSTSAVKGTTTTKIIVTARYADGSTANVTRDCQWSTNNSSVAWVADNSYGNVTAINIGTATITAYYRWDWAPSKKSASIAINTIAPPDTTAPTVTVSPNNGTISAGSAIYISASDTSGVGNIAYKWDSGSTTNVYYPATSTRAYAPASSGTHILSVWAQDRSANVNYTGWVNHSYTVPDTIPPIISLSSYPSSWTNSVIITAAISDVGGGVALKKWASGSRSTSYFTSSGTSFSGSTFAVSSNGTYTVYAKDIAGNAAVKTISITNIDNIAPAQPIIGFSSPTGYTSGTWANQNVTFTLTAGADTGGSGVKGTEYSTNGGVSWTTYISPVTITTEGTTSLIARTIDNAGNRSSNATATIKKDTTVLPPTIGFTSPAGYTSGTWTNQNVTFTITAAVDAGSGNKRTEYSINGGATWITYTVGVSISIAGTTTVWARSIDNVNNMSTNTIATINIDKTNPGVPTIGFTTPVGYTSGTWANQNVTFTLTSGLDMGAGVLRLEYSTNAGATWTTYTSPVTISTEATISILARTVDKAINYSTNTTSTIKLDKTGPANASLSINSNASETASTTVTLAISATDALSGLSNMMISNYANFTTDGNVANPVAAIPYAPSKSWITTTGGGQKYVYIKFFDIAGNTSTTSANILYIVRPTITSVTITGPRYYGQDMPISATGTNATQAAYRIFYTTSVTAPPVDYTVNAVISGAGWTDSLVSGSIAANTSTNVSDIVSGANLNNTTWTYITLKVAIGSVTDTWVWKYSQAYSLNSSSTSSADSYIGYVGHNQIININGNKIVLSDPNTPDLGYGPYAASDISKISSFNLFLDQDYVTYRLEFDAASPSQINDMKISLYFVGGIDMSIDKMKLEKQQIDGTFAVIKDLSGLYSRQGVGRYSVLLGNDNYGNSIITANGQGRYAVEYSGRIKIASFLGATINQSENLATIGIYTSGYTYPYTLQIDKTDRKFYIDSKIWGASVRYQ